MEIAWPVIRNVNESISNGSISRQIKLAEQRTIKMCSKFN